MNLIETLEQEEIARLGKKIPAFSPGDTVIVSVNVVEGTRKRVQAYEGVVIAKRNRGLNSGFTVRKISSGEGVERTFQTYSPLIAAIEVKRRGDVRRAKLYYLRERSGKSARIKEKLPRTREGGRRRISGAGRFAEAAAGLVLAAVFSFQPSDHPCHPSAPGHCLVEVAQLRPTHGCGDRHRHAPARVVQGCTHARGAARAVRRAARMEARDLDRAPCSTDRQPAHASVLVAIVGRERPTVILTERTTHLSTPLGPGRLSRRQERRHRCRRGGHRAARGARGNRPGAALRRRDRRAADLYDRFALRHHAGDRAGAPRTSACTLNAYEVADAFEVPLEFLMNPAHHRHHAIEIDGYRREWLSMPYMDGTSERFIWGATAAMLRNLYRFLAA